MLLFFKTLKFKSTIISIIFISFCCKERCKKDSDVRQRYFVEEDIKAYFPYITGSYWVYENQDKSKMDSIYVSYHKENWDTDMISCIKTEKINYTLKSSSKNLLIEDSVNILMQHNSLGQLNNLVFLLDDVRAFSFQNKSLSLYRLGYEPLFSIKSISLNKQIYEGELQEYKETNRNTNIYLQKRIGVIGWINKLDTFNLIKYQIAK